VDPEHDRQPCLIYAVRLVRIQLRPRHCFRPDNGRDARAMRNTKTIRSGLPSIRAVSRYILPKNVVRDDPGLKGHATGI
jgi:hypothetical protein